MASRIQIYYNHSFIGDELILINKKRATSRRTTGRFAVRSPEILSRSHLIAKNNLIDGEMAVY